jgi:serine/threonine protein phosphatase 1
MPLSLTLKLDDKQLGVTHASSVKQWGRIQQGELSEQEVWSCLWSRPLKAHYIEPIKQVDAVIHGHSPVDKVTQYRNRYWVDTYSANNRLSLTLAQWFLAEETPRCQRL